MGMRTLAAKLLDAVWPRVCAHCREPIKGTEPPLCPRCRAALRPAQPPYCLRCADPGRPSSLYCSRCSSGRPACRLIRAAFWYRGPAVSLVHAFKYRGRKEAARAAGSWMARAFERYPELGLPDALTAVPLHARRLRLRGYNQAQLIAEALGRELRVPVLPLLRRARATRPQWRLGRGERLQNLRGVIAAAEGAGRARGMRLLLIDDVCTSGASLEACAAALREAGAGPVDGFVFARQGRAST